MLAIEYPDHIWKVSPQLSCGDTCQICMRFKECHRYFCVIENFAFGEIDERSFSKNVSRVWDFDSDWQASRICDWMIYYRLGLPRVPLHCGLTWRVGIPTILQMSLMLTAPKLPACVTATVYSTRICIWIRPAYGPHQWLFLATTRKKCPTGKKTKQVSFKKKLSSGSMIWYFG